ncbi:MAG: NUDIX domain-containing protein [Acidocella sp.]|nr:NUDIX domain-containing protein [Acidocella sp.]
MLQQTVVATVIPYYAKFLAAYPVISRLGAAPLDEVLGLWAGLGYYARARNLHRCAGIVAEMGGFPRTIAGLRALPGIGPYTANAIGAIAFGLPVLPVDGNIERVAARIFAISDPVPQAKPKIAEAAMRFIEDAAAQKAPGDFAQALFDLGATICAPRRANCKACPWAAHCAGHSQGAPETLPVRRQKPARPHRVGAVYALIDKEGEVILLRNPPRGLLGGMLILPPAPPPVSPPNVKWRSAGTVDHVFTHFSLTLEVFVARTPSLPADALRARAATAAVPSVMRKALDAALRALDHKA